MKTFDLAEAQTLIRQMADLEKQYNSAAGKLAKLMGATMPTPSASPSAASSTVSAGAPPAELGIRWWPGKPGPKPKDWQEHQAKYEQWAKTKVAPTAPVAADAKVEPKAKKKAAPKKAAPKKAAPKSKPKAKAKPAAKKAAPKPKAKKKTPAAPKQPETVQAASGEAGAANGADSALNI